MTSGWPDRRVLGGHIRKWRRQRDLSQIELADRTGITQSTLSNYENGKREPAITTLIRLAEELDVSLDELTGRTERRR